MFTTKHPFHTTQVLVEPLFTSRRLCPVSLRQRLAAHVRLEVSRAILHATSNSVQELLEHRLLAVRRVHPPSLFLLTPAQRIR